MGRVFAQRGLGWLLLATALRHTQGYTAVTEAVFTDTSAFHSLSAESSFSGFAPEDRIGGTLTFYAQAADYFSGVSRWRVVQARQSDCDYFATLAAAGQNAATGGFPPGFDDPEQNDGVNGGVLLDIVTSAYSAGSYVSVEVPPVIIRSPIDNVANSFILIFNMVGDDGYDMQDVCASIPMCDNERVLASMIQCVSRGVPAPCRSCDPSVPFLRPVGLGR